MDVNYNPLAPESLRTAATSTDPAIAIYAVAKRIPVRLRLYIDQRRLQDLLANCGNHEIPVEVRQVRINCAEGLSSGSGGAMRAGGGVSLAVLLPVEVEAVVVVLLQLAVRR